VKGRARGHGLSPCYRRRDWKHSRQNTGRPGEGRNGTVVSFPHAEHVAVVSSRPRRESAASVGRLDARLLLQALQRLGSLCRFFPEKNSCSPAVQMKSWPQSEHCMYLSVNAMGLHDPAGAG